MYDEEVNKLNEELGALNARSNEITERIKLISHIDQMLNQFLSTVIGHVICEHNQYYKCYYRIDTAKVCHYSADDIFVLSWEGRKLSGLNGNCALEWERPYSTHQFYVKITEAGCSLCERFNSVTYTILTNEEAYEQLKLEIARRKEIIYLHDEKVIGSLVQKLEKVPVQCPMCGSITETEPVKTYQDILDREG